MNCPQCATSLPDSATFCYTCGASTRQTTFSYLPVGTPSWPTTVPESHSYSPGATSTVIQEGQSPAPAAKRPARPQRSARSILILVALFVLTPLVGVLATLGTLYVNGAFSPGAAASNVHIAAVAQPTSGTSNTPTPTTPARTNQLPTPTHFQTANSREVGITLKYPSDWVADAPQTTRSGNIFVYFHPPQQLPVEMSVGKLAPTSSTSFSDTAILNQAVLESFGSNSGLQNMQLLTHSPQSIGGTSWDEQDATFTISNGDLLRVASISVKHNNLYFNIFYFAPASVYDEAMQKYYTQMLSSFKFLA